MLTPLGECVVALWRHLHALNPALTASNSVVMPDHVHLLLIVNCDRDPAFRPLVFIHWFMEETERMMAAMDGGCAPVPLPSAMRNDYHSAMARGRQPQSNDVMIPAGERGRQPPSIAIWDRSFWLDLSFSSRQLKAIRRYIRLNPARALWKMRHPDRFLRHANIRHPLLAANRTWDAIGNLTLLGSPFLFPVRLTRKKTLECDAFAGGVRVYGDEPRIGFDDKIAACRRRKEFEPLPRSCVSVGGGDGKLYHHWLRLGVG